MKKRTINILNSDDIENITPESITGDAIERTHYNDLIGLINALVAEKKAYDKAIIAKHGNKSYKDDKTIISVYDSFLFNSADFISEYGQKKYDELKTKKSHTEKVVKY